jgi:putative oxidoreductase
MLKELLSTKSDPDFYHGQLLLLRIGVGLGMLTRGIPKMQKLLSGQFDFADPLGLGEPFSLALAAFAEFFCSILVIFGLGTRIAVIPLLITMFTVVFIVHAGEPFSKKELALLYSMVYLALLIGGSGKYSLDEKLFNKD